MKIEQSFSISKSIFIKIFIIGIVFGYQLSLRKHFAEFFLDALFVLMNLFYNSIYPLLNNITYFLFLVFEIAEAASFLFKNCPLVVEVVQLINPLLLSTISFTEALGVIILGIFVIFISFYPIPPGFF